MSLFWGRLDQFAGEVAGFGQQEEADLFHMGTCRDMDEVVCVVLMKARLPCQVVELGIHLLEVPWILEGDDVEYHICFGGDRVDVFFEESSEGGEFRGEDQMQFIDREVVLLDKTDVGAPCCPAVGSIAAGGVFLCTENG